MNLIAQFFGNHGVVSHEERVASDASEMRKGSIRDCDAVICATKVKLSQIDDCESPTSCLDQAFKSGVQVISYGLQGIRRRRPTRQESPMSWV